MILAWMKLLFWFLPFLSWGRCRSLCIAETSPAPPWPAPVGCASPPPPLKPDTPPGNRTPPGRKHSSREEKYKTKKTPFTFTAQWLENPRSEAANTDTINTHCTTTEPKDQTCNELVRVRPGCFQWQDSAQWTQMRASWWCNTPAMLVVHSFRQRVSFI